MKKPRDDFLRHFCENILNKRENPEVIWKDGHRSVTVQLKKKNYLNKE